MGNSIGVEKREDCEDRTSQWKPPNLLTKGHIENREGVGLYTLSRSPRTLGVENCSCC